MPFVAMLAKFESFLIERSQQFPGVFVTRSAAPTQCLVGALNGSLPELASSAMLARGDLESSQLSESGMHDFSEAIT